MKVCFYSIRNEDTYFFVDLKLFEPQEETEPPPPTPAKGIFGVKPSVVFLQSYFFSGLSDKRKDPEDNHLQGDVIRKNQIGAISGTWGPFFHVSFELIIHSYVKGKGKQGWSSVLAFDKKPSVDLNKNGELRIFFQQKMFSFNTFVEINKWYNLTIEQKPNQEKVKKKKLTVQTFN